MTHDELNAALELANATPEGDWQTLPEGHLLSAHVAFSGVGLTVTKVEAVRVAGTQLLLRTTRGETHIVSLADLFALAIDSSAQKGRRAGFTGG